jgi:hypothetical protein
VVVFDIEGVGSGVNGVDIGVNGVVVVVVVVVITDGIVAAVSDDIELNGSSEPTKHL